MLEPEKLPQQLEGYLSGVWADGADVTVSEYEQITGGYSRYMARFRATAGDKTQRLILRADPPPGQSILDTDRKVEWDLASALHGGGGVAIPAPLYFDDGTSLGAPAIVYQELSGPTMYVTVQEGEITDHFGLTEPLADTIADVHKVDIDTLPDALERPTSWDAYISAGATRWASAEAEHAERDPFMRVISAWLEANRPAPTDLTLVHGDFQAPNILMDEPSGRMHMLDWEVAHIGDPREDLGWWALAHTTQPPNLIAADQDRFLARYREATGLSEEVVNPESVAYFTVFASLTVFGNVIGATAAMARGQASGMTVAYMTNAIPSMHSIYVNAMRTAGAWREETA